MDSEPKSKTKSNAAKTASDKVHRLIEEAYDDFMNAPEDSPEFEAAVAKMQEAFSGQEFAGKKRRELK